MRYRDLPRRARDAWRGQRDQRREAVAVPDPTVCIRCGYRIEDGHDDACPATLVHCTVCKEQMQYRAWLNEHYMKCKEAAEAVREALNIMREARRA